jgi:hypothetical protein
MALSFLRASFNIKQPHSSHTFPVEADLCTNQLLKVEKDPANLNSALSKYLHRNSFTPSHLFLETRRNFQHSSSHRFVCRYNTNDSADRSVTGMCILSEQSLRHSSRSRNNRVILTRPNFTAKSSLLDSGNCVQDRLPTKYVRAAFPPSGRETAYAHPILLQASDQAGSVLHHKS